MDAQAILHELTHAEGLPREPLKAASAQRGDMVPLFLEEIENHLALAPAARAKSRHRSSSSFICSATGEKRPLIDRWHAC
jgi:hypothetical protein